MSQIPALDYGFLLLETKESPTHVAALEIMRPPKGAAADYVKKFAAKLRERKPCSPFNYKIRAKVPNPVSFVPGLPSGSIPVPQWRVASSIDMKKHVLYHKMPGSGTRKQLTELIQKLHETMLKRSRPLWECHVIGGLEGGERFVVYTKVHHAIMDGMMGATLFYRNSAITPGPEAGKALWELPRGWTEPEISKNPIKTARDLFKGLLDSGTLTKNITKSVIHTGKNALRKSSEKSSKPKPTRPFSAQPTSLDRSNNPDRSLYFGHIPVEQAKSLAKACGVSINDLLLTALDVAVRKFLTDAGDEIDKPLVGLMPMALRTEVLDTSEANSVVIMPIKLGNKSDSFPERLRAIVESTQAQKAAREESGEDTLATTVMMMGIAHVGESLKLTGAISPLGNFLYSNVLGPREARYRFDAKIEELYPLSVLSAGFGLNITSYSYAGKIFFQFIAMKKAAPDLRPLMENLQTALNEFEHLVLSKLAADAEKSGKKSKTKKKAVKKTTTRKTKTEAEASKKTTVKKSVAAKKTASTTKKKTTTKKATTSKKATAKKTASSPKKTTGKTTAKKES